MMIGIMSTHILSIMNMGSTREEVSYSVTNISIASANTRLPCM